MLGVGESIAFPGSSKIIARHVPPERRGIANAAVATGHRARPGGRNACGRPDRRLIGAGARCSSFSAWSTLIWLLPWQRTVRSLPATGHYDEGASVPARKLLAKWPLWSMSIVHALGNYCFYFLLAWLALVPHQVARLLDYRMSLLATLGYAVQGACAFGYGHFSDWWTRSGRSEAMCRRWMMVASQSLAAVGDPWAASPIRRSRSRSCCASRARPPPRSR